jgi:hypothetical protein
VFRIPVLEPRMPSGAFSGGNPTLGIGRRNLRSRGPYPKGRSNPKNGEATAQTYIPRIFRASTQRLAGALNPKRGVFIRVFWSHPSDSNRRPADYESAALPAELGWRPSIDHNSERKPSQERHRRKASPLPQRTGDFSHWLNRGVRKDAPIWRQVLIMTSYQCGRPPFPNSVFFLGETEL